MRTITKYELKAILESHQLWLRGEVGERADLSSADLRSANLRSANLRSANLSYANLRSADLSYANLSSANLSSANLSSANLSSANLSYADLSYADLRSADLSNSDLRYANLSYANLRYADLSTSRINCAIGNMAEIKTLLLEVWPITYTAEHLHIGCERHLISDWWDFDDDRIARMDIKALGWWKKWKDFIRQAIEMSPAVPTGREESDAAA